MPFYVSRDKILRWGINDWFVWFVRLVSKPKRTLEQIVVDSSSPQTYLTCCCFVCGIYCSFRTVFVHFSCVEEAQNLIIPVASIWASSSQLLLETLLLFCALQTLPSVIKILWFRDMRHAISWFRDFETCVETCVRHWLTFNDGRYLEWPLICA